MQDEINVDTEATETLENVDTEATETPEESIEEVKARLAKAEEVAANQRIRAEKAEGKLKDVKPAESKTDGLTTKDTIAIMNAKVHEDDIDEVVDYAKFKKIPVSEALKSGVVKTLLAEKAEQRTVAEATNTSGARRSSAKLTDEALMSNIRGGQLPESDADIQRALKVKMGLAKK